MGCLNSAPGPAASLLFNDLPHWLTSAFLRSQWAGPVSDSPGSRVSVNKGFLDESCFPRLCFVWFSRLPLFLPRSSCLLSGRRRSSPCVQGCCSPLLSLGIPVSSKKRMMCASWEGEWVLRWWAGHWREGDISSSEPQRCPSTVLELFKFLPCCKCTFGRWADQEHRWGQGSSHYILGFP